MEERLINNLLFCPEVGASEVFEDVRAYDEHTMEGRHTTAAPESTMMDKIRRRFVSRMKLTSQIHMTLTRGDNLDAEVDLQTACNLYSTMQVFQHMGLALPRARNNDFNMARQCPDNFIIYLHFVWTS